MTQIQVTPSRRLVKELLCNQSLNIFGLLQHARENGIEFGTDNEYDQLVQALEPVAMALAQVQLFPRRDEDAETGAARQVKYVEERAAGIGSQALTRWALHRIAQQNKSDD